MITRRASRIAGFSLIFALVWWSSALADEVQLKNGDLLSGEIIGMEKEVLSLTTTYGGEIRVRMQEVACLGSDRELTVVLKDKEVLIGRVICLDSNSVRIEGPKIGVSAKLSLAEVESINPSPPPPAVSYKGDISAGGSLTDGNTDTRAANVAARFEARSKRHRFTLGGKYNYGESGGELTARNASGSFKYDFFVTKRLYNYAQSLFERDDFQDLNLRSTLGLGLGYQILDSRRVSLFAEAGISYFNEDFKVAEDRRYASGRWSVGFDLEIIPDRLKFFHLHEGYYSLEKSDAYYIRSEQGFRLPLVRNFLANFQVDYSYNSQPASGKRKSDTTYIFGLAYEYEF